MLATDGRGGMLVPRLEVEHAQANAAVHEVAHYDEYPGERHPIEALRELLDALGVRERLGADQDGYPWVFGYRGPGLGEFTHVADLVEDQMAIKTEAEIALLRESYEGPFLDRGDETEIRPGMVFTIEPGLYAAGLGGFRHSDTVVVRDEGLELLTYSPCPAPRSRVDR